MTTKKVIAVVRLNAGQGAYYDELTRIHLTVRHPQANVYAGMNVSGLRRSVKSGRLRLVQGSFGDEEQTFRIGYRDGQRVLIVSNSYAAAAPKAPEREKQQEDAASQMTHTKIDEVVEEAPAAAETVEEKKAEVPVEAEAKTEAEPEAETEAVVAPAVEEAPAAAEADKVSEEEADSDETDAAADDAAADTTAAKKTTRRRRSRKSTTK